MQQTNEQVLRKARNYLGELLGDVEAKRWTGWISVAIFLTKGEAQQIRRQIDGTERT